MNLKLSFTALALSTSLLAPAVQAQEVAVQPNRQYIDLNSRIDALSSLVDTFMGTIETQVSNVSVVTVANDEELTLLREKIEMLKADIGLVEGEGGDENAEETGLEGQEISCSSTYTDSGVAEESIITARINDNSSISVKFELLDKLSKSIITSFDWTVQEEKTVVYRNPFTVNSPGGFIGASASVETMTNEDGNVTFARLTGESQLLRVNEGEITTQSLDCAAEESAASQ